MKGTDFVLERNCLSEWMSWSPSFKASADSRNIFFPGDIRKTHFLILRNTKTLLNLEYHKKQLWRHIFGKLICGFFCAVIHFTRVIWIRMWGQPSELAPIMMECDAEIRKKASSKVYDVWIAGLLKMNWKHGQCTEINISLFRLQTSRTLNESVLNVSDLKALQ